MPLLLDVRNLTVRYGAVEAATDVSIHVEEGETVTIIGSNGAGKSTLLRAITGLEKPWSGQILFRGQAIHGWPAFRIAASGIGLVPEGRRLFPQMTVIENLQLGAFRVQNKTATIADMDRVFALFPRLCERSGQIAQTLSGGEQQMLAIGRALMARVQLLLLDEPSLGLAPILVRNIASAIADVQNREGIGIVLVEQNARVALSLAQRAYVLETGRMVAEGSSQEIAGSPLVRSAYLGL